MKKEFINQGTNSKPVSSKALVKFFLEKDQYQGELFIGYPLIGTADGRSAIDALWISPKHGIVVFDLVEGQDADAFGERQDDNANKIEARLRNHKELMGGRKLLPSVTPMSFAPGIRDLSRLTSTQHVIANLDTLDSAIDSLTENGSNQDLHRAILSALQSISSIRKHRTKRVVKEQDSRGGKLKELEESIATLDSLQSKAVIETVNGVQRIRGLAGSGKTVVLALKAAYLHGQHPDWRIAVTFNSRSLKGQLRRLINNFCIEQTGDEPDWNNLRIIHAWGAPGGGDRDGIYYEYCRTHNVEYMDVRAARVAFGQGQEFSGACTRALEKPHEPTKLYDAILVDEAQDFSPAFLRLCYDMLDGERRLVYAYDELQNLSGNSLPSPEEIFGNDQRGTPLVRLDNVDPNAPQRDIILKTCYRNSEPVLVSAHALGFGIYRKPPHGRELGMVQMFDHPQLWEDIGYEVKDGSLSDGQSVTLVRTEETSPGFLKDHSPIDDLVQFKAFKSEEEQTNWVVSEIKKNLTTDELRHDDIVVINPDPLSTREKVGAIRKLLHQAGIQTHIAGVDTSPDLFFATDTDSVTFTGIYRAKGNEAGMIYIINAHDCETAKYNLASVRNRLFTAMTRSKAWVRVLGVGESMQRLVQEFEELKQLRFELKFRYPTKKEREQLSIVHRDMTEAERKKIESRQGDLFGLLEDLKSGKLHLEDLPPELVEEFTHLLKQRKQANGDS